jgi:hypothetical protein
MIYVRDSLRITAGIAAESQYARVWVPGGKPSGFINDPALQVLPEYHPVMIHSLHVAVYTTLGNLRRGVVIELCNLTDQRGQHSALRTQPSAGLQGFSGIRYDGPPFLCTRACGWWTHKSALVDGDTIYMWLSWEGV